MGGRSHTITFSVFPFKNGTLYQSVNQSVSQPANDPTKNKEDFMYNIFILTITPTVCELKEMCRKKQVNL